MALFFLIQDTTEFNYQRRTRKMSVLRRASTAVATRKAVLRHQSSLWNTDAFQPSSYSTMVSRWV